MTGEGRPDGNENDPWDEDHLAFFLDGLTGSTGAYRPRRFELRGDGKDGVRDRVLHAHEAHHAMLNDSTTWGIALHLTARHRPWQALGLPLRDACRTVHESFATFMSVSAVSGRFPQAERVLEQYPDYQPLYVRTAAAVAQVAGPHRQALAVSALARASMQTPVLQRLSETWPDGFTLSLLREVDRPDGRWNRLLRGDRGALMGAAARAVDQEVATAFGDEALTADRPEADPSAAVADAFDDAWERWEDLIYRRVAEELRGMGATVLPFLGGRTEAVELADRIQADDPDGPPVRVQPPDVPHVDDATFEASLVRQARHWIVPEPRPAQLITLGPDVDPEEVVRVVDASARIAGRPSLVTAVRLPARLLEGYAFDARAEETLARLEGPTVAVRAVADDGAGGDAVWHTLLREPADLDRLAELWADRGPLLHCVAASCLFDRGWQSAWLPALEETGRLFVLLDVGVVSVLPSWPDGTVLSGLYLDLGGSDWNRRGLLLASDHHTGVWLAVGDETGIETLVSQLSHTESLHLRMEGADWTDWAESLQPMLVHLFATESFFDAAALEPPPDGM
ncbi:hypothetical protein OG241_05805 [Streptomyces sp. NBC_01390]|uniref:hypothetical protein n=1 Tax=Streptomyces sp. NBC_01390 TaxID=2903850 RepID=UPI00324B605B